MAAHVQDARGVAGAFRRQCIVAVNEEFIHILTSTFLDRHLRWKGREDGNPCTCIRQSHRLRLVFEVGVE